jgi:hypothetical protein
MAKTLTQKKRYKRWLRKHPVYYLKRLRHWLEVEEDPKEKELAETLLKEFLKRYPSLRTPADKVAELGEHTDKQRG